MKPLASSLLAAVKQAYHALSTPKTSFAPKNIKIFLPEEGALLLSGKDLRWSIEHGRCFVGGMVERFCSHHLQGDEKVLCWPVARPHFVREEARVLYEDEELLLYNKPPYLSSEELAKLLGVKLVHRLDRDTSGVILFAKRDPDPFEALFRNRKIRKTYHALVEGSPQERGTLSLRLGIVGRREGAILWGVTKEGLWSETEWVCERRVKEGSLLRCHPHTGRTHQIRIHMRALSHPILGDDTYGSRRGRAGIFRPLLHATRLEWEGFSIEAPFPEDFFIPKEV